MNTTPDTPATSKQLELLFTLGEEWFKSEADGWKEAVKAASLTLRNASNLISAFLQFKRRYYRFDGNEHLLWVANAKYNKAAVKAGLPEYWCDLISDHN